MVYSKALPASQPWAKYVLFPAVPSFHAIMLPILLWKRIMYIIYLLHRSSFLWPLITFADVAPLSSVKAWVIRFWGEIAPGKSASAERTGQLKKEVKYFRLDAIEQDRGVLQWKLKERVCRMKFCFCSSVFTVSFNYQIQPYLAHLLLCPLDISFLMLLCHFRLMKLQTSQLFSPAPANHSSLLFLEKKHFPFFP